MAFTDNFGNPQGFLGRLMLVAMERERLPMAKWAFSLFDVPQEGQIADIGCGGGYNIKRLLQKSADAKVWGLDISEESVKKARKVNKAAPLSRCEILQASADALPFTDGQLDFVTAFETVFFLEGHRARIQGSPPGSKGRRGLCGREQLRRPKD